jgi:hypothetical protein
MCFAGHFNHFFVEAVEVVPAEPVVGVVDFLGFDAGEVQNLRSVDVTVISANQLKVGGEYFAAVERFAAHEEMLGLVVIAAVRGSLSVRAVPSDNKTDRECTPLPVVAAALRDGIRRRPICHDFGN